MNFKELSKQEYIARINKVMDYVSQNIDKQIDLSVMAKIALFSPYHFHRIFTFMMDETPNGFVSRIRLEKAAQLLYDSPKISINEIAFHCGFCNISSFSRAFKGYFGMSAKEFRLLDKAVFVKDGIRYSKDCKLISNIGKNKQQINSQFCNVEFKKLIIMNTKIEIKQMPELNLIYCRHTGAFNQIGKAYEKLFKWAAPRGLVTPETRTVTVYLDDPAITNIEKVRQDASMIVEGDIKVEGEIGKSTVAAGEYAVGHFEIKETEFEKAWNTMCSWLTESGYQPGNSSPYELYYSNQHSEDVDFRFILDICIPVKPL